VEPASISDAKEGSDHMRNLRWPLMLLLVLASLVVAACGDDDDDGEEGASTTQDGGQAAAIQKDDSLSAVKLTIGSKNFTEQKVLGEIYAQALAAGGYDVSTELNLGDEKTALAALEGGDIDAYPEYTGTALLSFFGFQADELPKDEQEAYQEAKKGFAEKNLTALPPTPFTSSNEVAVTQETADQDGLKKISDLSKVADRLTLYGSPECRQRLDCLLGLQEVYGLEFKKFTPVDIALRHEVLTEGQADVSIVFTTDPQIERENEVLLEDDKGMFPPYNSTLVVRDEVLKEAGGKFEEVVGLVNRGLTDKVMQELNARVDLDKETPKQVATQYLQETGLISS
jgi:osmoprotectant transport system substrate-binding protein